MRNDRDESVKSSPNKVEVKSLKKQEPGDQTDDEQYIFEQYTISNVHETEDLDELWRTVSLQSQESHLKDKEESEAHIFQRLNESAPKLTADQLFAIVRYHTEQQEVIAMQREAADIIRRSVDSEYHEHFEVPHNHGSANDVLASIYLKVLMDKFYDL